MDLPAREKNMKTLWNLAYFTIAAGFLVIFFIALAHDKGPEFLWQYIQKSGAIMWDILAWTFTFLGFAFAAMVFLPKTPIAVPRGKSIFLFCVAVIISLFLAVFFAAMSPPWLLTAAALALSAITFLWSRGKQRERAKAEI